MRRVSLLAFVFACGLVVGNAGRTKPVSARAPESAVTVTYPAREVTHPGTGETSTVFRTVRLVPRGGGSGAAWTFDRGGAAEKYAELPD